MVVVLIIGIMASGAMVMFSRGGPSKDLNDGVEKFVQLSHQISDLSILAGEPMGLVLTPPDWSTAPLEERSWSYAWKRYVELPNEGGSSSASWVDIDGLEAVSFAREIELFVHIEGHEWDWKAGPQTDQPLIVLFPSGEAEPFEFEIEIVHQDLVTDEPQHVKLDHSGRLQWTEAVEAMAAIEERFN